MPSGAYFLPCCSRLCPDTPAEPPWCCPPPAKKNGIALQAIFCKKVLTTPPGYGIILKQSGGRHNRWGFSSAGRALAWHARGHRFDPGILHQKALYFVGSMVLFFLLKPIFGGCIASPAPFSGFCRRFLYTPQLLTLHHFQKRMFAARFFSRLLHHPLQCTV